MTQTELRTLVRHALLSASVGVLAGLASALFLVALERATATREAHPWLLVGLPLAGAAIGWIYARFAGRGAGGNNLLLDEIHAPTGPVPFRMAPLILATTVVTHLFGGSAGREGTAVQMGGALGDLVARTLRLAATDRRLMLMAGIAAGFGAVFGTPLAGAVFGMEVLALGTVEASAIVPCLVASVVGDLTCRAVGVSHVGYRAAPSFSSFELTKVLLASVLFGLASLAFVELTHALGSVGKSAPAWLRPLVGGVVVIGLTLAVGNQQYNGLGVPLIQRSFTDPNVPLEAFALKLLFTAVTLGSGFKGGEVTPLFCIGATLGNAFARLTGGDMSLYAALGFVGVFAGAANTPIACAIMGMELFGAGIGVPLAVACVVATVVSGRRGIYASQRVEGRSLMEWRSDQTPIAFLGKALHPPAPSSPGTSHPRKEGESPADETPSKS